MRNDQMVNPRFVLKVSTIVIYCAVAFRMSVVAYRYLIDPDKTHWTTPMLHPELFRPEGQIYRRRALQFIWFGIVFVLAIVALL